MSRRGSRRVAGLAVLALCVACASPLERGQRRYREGDRLGALEIWRAVPASNGDYGRVRGRIAEVEAEFDELVVRYKRRARYFESAGRLAESILNYRLALKLRPDDRETLAHVQQLARALVARKAELRESLTAVRDAGEQDAARAILAELRELDPFDPALESEVRTEVQRAMEEGRGRLRSNDLAGAARSFRHVLALDPEDESPESESASDYLACLDALQRSENGGGRAATRLCQTITEARGAVKGESLGAEIRKIRARGFHRSALAAERREEDLRGQEAIEQALAAIRYELRALKEDPDYVEAQRHLEELRARMKPYVEDWVDQGIFLFNEEDLDRALDQWRQALLVDPDNQRALEYTARAQRMLDNLQRLRAEPGQDVGAR